MSADRTEGVRTHSVRLVSSAGHVQQVELACSGCGQCWPHDADREALERQPCGTRGDQP